MQKEVYQKTITCQDVFTLKNHLINAPYRSIIISYASLIYATKPISLAAYDLYIELKFLIDKSAKKELQLTAAELMKLAGFTRRNTFFKAKNELLEARLITSIIPKGHNEIPIYTLRFNADWCEKFYQIPWPVWNWLGRMLINKTMNRNQRHLYIYLYTLWKISGANENFHYNPWEFKEDFHLSQRTAANTFKKLEQLGLLLKRRASSNQNTPVTATLCVVSGLHYTKRYQAPEHVSLTNADLLEKIAHLKKLHGF